MNRLDKIYVVGSNTVVGRALLCVLRDSGYQNLYPIGDKEPNLLDKKEVESFFKEYHPDYVFLAGGKSGGIKANQRFPASLMLNNLMIECHVMDAAFSYGAKKLLYIASSCCYPKHCEQPMKPESLFTGKLEPTRLMQPQNWLESFFVKLIERSIRQTSLL
jgi:GDP-L-fucose synthase